MARVTDANRRWWVLITMTGALSMVLIDSTVVSVALPTIQRELDASQTGIQWVVNGYLLALAALVALGGRVGDSIGNSRTFKLGAAVFVLSSAACGLAGTELSIVIARAVQGMGAAFMLPATGAIVINAFGVEERGRAMGIYAGISMIFLALGPLLGGLLTEHVTWRAVFWINLPIGATMLILARATVPHDRRGARLRLSPVELVMLVGGLAALVGGLMQSDVWGFSAPAIVILLATGTVLLVAFVALEPRRQDALLELALFRNRNFSANVAVLFAIQFALIGMTVFGAIWIQNVLRFSPTEAGLSLLPMLVPLIFVAPLAGRVYERLGPRLPVALGAVTVGTSLMLTAALLPKESYAWIVGPYVAMGVGIALVMTPASTDSLNVAAPGLRGEASGLVQTVRQVGGTVGLAVMGAIVAHVQAAELALTSGVASAYYASGALMVIAGLFAGAVLRRVVAADEQAEAVPPAPHHPRHPGPGAA
jgi:EmrB/QacA subfamily drug resistance transporter